MRGKYVPVTFHRFLYFLAMAGGGVIILSFLGAASFNERGGMSV